MILTQILFYNFRKNTGTQAFLESWKYLIRISSRSPTVLKRLIASLTPTTLKKLRVYPYKLIIARPLTF